MDAFYRQRDAETARRVAGLLGDLDHETRELGELESRLTMRATLDDLAVALPDVTHQELVERIFEPDTDGMATTQLATDVVIAAIEAGAFDVALRLVPLTGPIDSQLTVGLPVCRVALQASARSGPLGQHVKEPGNSLLRQCPRGFRFGV